MSVYTPETQVENNLFNPNKDVRRKVLNSGYLLTQDFLSAYQQLMQDAVQNAFIDFMKYPGIVRSGYPLYITSYNRSFELLGHQVLGGSPCQHRFVINAGTFMDAYGNRVTRNYCTTVDLTMSAVADGQGYAYLCARKLNFSILDFIVHPVVGIPQPTKVITDVEFFLSDSSFEALADPLLIYPPLDANEYINGIVIAKIFTSGSPDPSFRTALIAVKDGDATDIAGFIETNPSVID